MNTASYSVLAKVHARFGRMLGEDDYTALMACRTLSDFTAYMHGKRDYTDAIAELTGSQFSRGQLEFLLRENRFRENIAMCVSIKSFDKELSDFFIGLEEANFILNILLELKNLDGNPHLNTPLRAFYRYTRINITAFKEAHDYASFLNALKDSRYYAILKKFQTIADEKLDYTTIESAVFHKLYGDFISMEKKSTDLTELIFAVIELSNISILYRDKKIFGGTERVRDIILPYWYKVDRSTAESLITADLKDFIDLLSRTRYAGLVTGGDNDFDLEIERRRLLRDRYVHTLHFSMDASALAFAFIQLKNFELRNLIIIIEGIRYDVSAQTVKRLLVY